MGTAIQKAIALIFSSDPELLNILSTTAQLCLTSSVLALLMLSGFSLVLREKRKLSFRKLEDLFSDCTIQKEK